MEAIIEQAERLGKSIADSRQAQAFRAAQEQFDKDPDALELYKDYQEQSQKLAALEAENKPIEVDDKHKLEQLRAKLLANETFKKLSAAQVDYVDMMRRVNTAMQQHMSPPEAPAEQ